MVHPAVRALLRTTPTLAPISNRGILSVTGSQAQEFLNGIVSSTVPTSYNHHFYSSFLHAQARATFLSNYRKLNSQTRAGFCMISLFTPTLRLMDGVAT